MSTVPRHIPRYTVDDYRLWKGDWELWDGYAIAMTPSPFGRHQAVLFSLAREIGIALKTQRCDATVLGDLDWIVGPETVVRPDLIIVCGPAPEEHLRHPPALIAEILSPPTQQNDLTFKRHLYADQGVATYLIIEPTARSLEHLILGMGGAYQSVPPAEVLRLEVCNGCELAIEVSSIFD